MSKKQNLKEKEQQIIAEIEKITGFFKILKVFKK